MYLVDGFLSTHRWKNRIIYQLIILEVQLLEWPCYTNCQTEQMLYLTGYSFSQPSLCTFIVAFVAFIWLNALSWIYNEPNHDFPYIIAWVISTIVSLNNLNIGKCLHSVCLAAYSTILGDPIGPLDQQRWSFKRKFFWNLCTVIKMLLHPSDVDSRISLPQIRPLKQNLLRPSCWDLPIQ